MANDIIAVVGMAFEARIVAGPGLFVLSGVALLDRTHIAIAGLQLSR